MSHGEDVWYSSDNFVFKVDACETVHRVPSSHKNKVDVIASNSWAVFTNDNDKNVIRFEKGAEVQKAQLPTKGLVMQANETQLFVLSHQSEVFVCDAKDLSIKKQKKMGFNATAMAVCGSNIWLGDNKGFIYTLDAASLDEKKKQESHNGKGVKVMSANSKYVASGDAYRYIWIWDNETMEEYFNHGVHKDRIISLDMNESRMAQTSLNFDYGITDLENKKVIHQAKNPHQERTVENIIIHKDQVLTSGRDCAFRMWPLV